jgi:hypothetical protein
LIRPALRSSPTARISRGESAADPRLESSREVHDREPSVARSTRLAPDAPHRKVKRAGGMCRRSRPRRMKRAMQARFSFVTLWALLALASASAQTLQVPGAGPPEQLVRGLADTFNRRYMFRRIDARSLAAQRAVGRRERHARRPGPKRIRRLMRQRWRRCGSSSETTSRVWSRRLLRSAPIYVVADPQRLPARWRDGQGHGAEGGTWAAVPTLISQPAYIAPNAVRGERAG